MPQSARHSPLPDLVGSWPITQIGSSPRVFPNTVLAKATILGVLREPSGGFDVDGRSLYIWVDGVQHNVGFVYGDLLPLSEVVSQINTAVGASVASDDNGFLRLTSPTEGGDSSLRLQTDAASTPTDVFLNLGLFSETESYAGDITQAQHVDPDRQVALPGQLAMSEGESFVPGTFNRALYQMAINNDRSEGLLSKKRIVVDQAIPTHAYVSPGLPEGYQVTGDQYVFTGDAVAPSQAELEKLVAVLDAEGREFIKEEQTVISALTVTGQPDPASEFTVLEDGGSPFTADHASGNYFVLSSNWAGPGTVVNGIPLKIIEYINADQVRVAAVDPSDGSVVDLESQAGVSANLISIIKHRAKVTGIYDSQGGSRVEGVASSKRSAVVPTRVERNNRIVAVGEDFLSGTAVAIGDVLEWSGLTLQRPFSNNGTYRVSRIIDKETLEVVNSDWTSAFLNSDLSAGAGTFDVDTDGQFYKDPFFQFASDGAPEGGDQIQILFRGMSTIREATDDPTVFSRSRLFDQEADDSVQKAILKIYGPSASSIDDVIYGDVRLNVEMQSIRMDREHNIYGRHTDTYHDNIFVYGNVGIGTISPSSELHVQGTDYPTIHVESTDIYGGTLRLSLPSGFFELYLSNTDQALNFWNGSDYVATFGLDGDVGINVQGPEARFHVRGDDLGGTAGNSVNVFRALTYDNDKDEILLQAIRQTTDGAPSWDTAFWKLQRVVNDSSVMGYIGFGSSSSGGDLLTFGEGTTERMRIDGSGNVGIGTTAPTYKLQIDATDLSADTGIFLRDPSPTSASPNIVVQGQRNDDNVHQAFSGKLALSHWRSGATPVFTNTSLGAVVFGGNHTDGSESNIAYPASIQARAEATFSDVNTMPTCLVFYTGSTGRALNYSAGIIGTEAMRIDSTGRVGIGTSPAHLLHIEGSGYPTLHVESTDGDGGTLRLSSDSGTKFYEIYLEGDSDYLGFWNGTDVTVVVGLDGKVGIGEDGPGSLLSVGGNAAIGTYSSSAAPANSLIVSGSVGIGTSSPDTLLELFQASEDVHHEFIKIAEPTWADSDTKYKSIVWENLTGNMAGIGATLGADNIASIDFHSIYNAAYKSETDVAMSIRGNGNVGIGTASPTTTLHLVATSDTTLRITSNDDLEGAGGSEHIATIDWEGLRSARYDLCAKISVRQDGTWSTVTDNYSPAAIEFYTQDATATDAMASPRMTIDSTGRVSIGGPTTSNIQLFVERDMAPNAYALALFSRAHLDSASTSQHVAIHGEADCDATSGTVSSMVGVGASLDKNGGCTITNFWGLRATYDIDGGAVGSWHGVQVGGSSEIRTATTVTNMYGFKYEPPSTMDGTLTNQYGLYIDNLDSAVNNYGIYIDGSSDYAIYVNGGDTYLADRFSLAYVGATDLGSYIFDVDVERTFSNATYTATGTRLNTEVTGTTVNGVIGTLIDGSVSNCAVPNDVCGLLVDLPTMLGTTAVTGSVRAIEIRTATGWSGTATGAYGLYIGNVTQGTSGNWAIMTNSGGLRFGTSSSDEFYARGATNAGTGTTTALYINTSNGQLGLNSSSLRIKKDVVDMGDMEWLYDTRPVQFTHKDTGERSYGLIAEELLEVQPDLVYMRPWDTVKEVDEGYNPEVWERIEKGEDGKSYAREVGGIHYDRFIPILINELKKLRNRIITLEAAAAVA